MRSQACASWTRCARSPLTPGREDPRFISEDGKKSYAVVTSNVSVDETRNVVDEVRRKVRSDELETYVTGAPAVYQDLEDASNEDVKQAEKYAFPFAVVILIFAFGTLVAAGVPVLIGGASVLTTLAALYFIAGFYDMSVFTLTLSTMLGLGLGIDYALFFVSRFREELEDYSDRGGRAAHGGDCRTVHLLLGDCGPDRALRPAVLPLHVHAFHRGGRGCRRLRLRHRRADASARSPRCPRARGSTGSPSGAAGTGQARRSGAAAPRS